MAILIIGSVLFAIALVTVSFHFAFGGARQMVEDEVRRKDLEEGRIIYIQSHMARYWKIREEAALARKMDALVEKMKAKKIVVEDSTEAA